MCGYFGSRTFYFSKGVIGLKILALWGNGSKGKTTTLNLLTKLLSNNLTQINDQKNPINNRTKDNCYVVMYKEKRIGVTTRGDTKEVLEEDFKWLKSRFNGTGCDLYVCASRSKGSSAFFIKNQVGDEDIFWVSKITISQEKKSGYVTPFFIENQQKKVNEKQAESLVGFIDEMIQNNII